MAKNLALFITNACNFKCKICLREYGRSAHLSLNLIKKILPEAKKLGYENFALTGGEPCLHPRFEEIVAFIVSLESKFGFVSNGSLLEKYKFLTEKYKDQILYACFSLDGSTAQINDSIREPGSFEKVIESIKYFVAQAVHTKIVVCLNQLNKKEISPMVELGKKLGIQSINFAGAIKTSLNKDIVLNDIEKVQCMAAVLTLKTKTPDIELFATSALQASGGVDFCDSLSLLDSLAINPQGELIFCCDTIKDGAVLGSLEKETFLDLYCKALDLSAELRKIRAKMIYESKFSEGFNTCDFCNSCLEKLIK